MKKLCLALFSIAACVAVADVALPPPEKSGGKPLMNALAERRTSRDFKDAEIAPDVLSSLLWAADGINRADGRRTAPTGLNVQDLDIFVMLPAGVYVYDAKVHALKLVNAGDHRADAGKQTFPRSAPLNLFYVQNLDRSMKADAGNTARHGGIHAGAVMQNVYLYCASRGLGCVARDSLDRVALAKTLRLRPDQWIMLGQTVGWPKN